MLAADETRGAILLEPIGDGTPLVRAERTPPVDEVADLLGALRSAAPPPGENLEPLALRVRFVLEHWIGRRERDPRMRAAVAEDAIPASVERAVALARDAGETVLLHGDLHPGNVLEGGRQRGLTAIDPRPCAGDPAYDAADWVLYGPRPTVGYRAPPCWRRRSAPRPSA